LQPQTNDSYGYDNASRLLSVNDWNNNSATYSYLANSPLVSQITFQNGATTRMTTAKQYDDLNRLTSVSEMGRSLRMAYLLRCERVGTTSITSLKINFSVGVLCQLLMIKIKGFES
jgi:hypothetical protein